VWSVSVQCVAKGSSGRDVWSVSVHCVVRWS
jgi:hypothetical protein